MADLKTYSVVIAWNDNQRDEGTYGDTVRARDGEHAERIVRARMMRNQWEEWSRIDPTMSKSDVADMYAVETWQGVQYFGACHERTEGAAWKASDMESVLRDLVAAWAMPGGRIVDAQAVVERAQKIVAELDAL